MFTQTAPTLQSGIVILHLRSNVQMLGGASCDSVLCSIFLLVLFRAVQSIQIRSIPPGQKWPGFSFALHLLRVRGFSFALLQYNPIQAFTAAFMPFMQLYRPRHKTAHKDLQGFSDYFPLLFCGCASCYTAPPAPHRNTSQRRSNSSAYRILAATLDAVQVSTSTYYNKVYKGATHRRPCQPGGVCSCCLRITGKC